MSNLSNKTLKLMAKIYLANILNNIELDNDTSEGRDFNKITDDETFNNFVDEFNTDKEILQGILQVTEAIKIRQPQAKLCVMGILPRANTEKRIQQINKELRKKLEQNCIYINLSNLLTDKNGIINSSLFSDGLHPNTKGYEKIAEVLKTYLDN